MKNTDRLPSAVGRKILRMQRLENPYQRKDNTIDFNERGLKIHKSSGHRKKASPKLAREKASFAQNHEVLPHVEGVFAWREIVWPAFLFRYDLLSMSRAKVTQARIKQGPLPPSPQAESAMPSRSGGRRSRGGPAIWLCRNASVAPHDDASIQSRVPATLLESINAAVWLVCTNKLTR